MKVEQALYQAIKASPLSSHAAWHAARIPANLVPVRDRPAWRTARAAAGNPLDWATRGSGREFLRFHRMMMRHHAWFMETTPSLTAAFEPWTDLPCWLMDHLPCRYLCAFEKEIQSIMDDGDPRSDDRLGAFLEATDRCNTLGSNIHNISHGLIAMIEAKEYHRHPAALADAGMDDPATALHNELFWKLHAWIDALYARWQRSHGEPVDQRPLAPSMGQMPVSPAPGDPAAGAPLMPHTHGASMTYAAHDDTAGVQNDPRNETKPYVATPGLQAIVRARFNPM